MKAFFKELFEYSHHCNQKLAELFNEHPDKTSEKAVKLFSHVLNAQQIWNNRIDPVQAVPAVWDLRPVQEFKAIDKVNFEHSLRILGNADLDAIISYTTSRGELFSNNIRDILFHAINHSTYHRAQIATEFKLQGLEPPVTDYIFYKR